MEPRCYHCNTLLADINAACPSCLPNWNRTYAPEVPQPDAPVSWEEQRYLDAQATIAALQAQLQTARYDAVRAFVHGEDKMCLVCGAKEPCELKSDPCSPCTFEPTPMELLKANQSLVKRVAALQAQVKELEQAIKETHGRFVSEQAAKKDVIDELTVALKSDADGQVLIDKLMQDVLKLESQLTQRTAELEAAQQERDRSDREADQTLAKWSDVSTQLDVAQAELERVRGERDEAVEAAARPTWVCDGCGRASSEGWINRVIESLDGTEYEMECPACEGRNIEEDSASDLAVERDELRALIVALPKVSFRCEVAERRDPEDDMFPMYGYTGSECHGAFAAFQSKETAQAVAALLQHRQGMEG